MLEAANRASRAVNADFAKAIVCFRDELSDEIRQQLKTPTTTVQFDLAPVSIFWYGDLTFAEGARQRLKELVDLGALPVTHGWSHAYVDDVAYQQVVAPMSQDEKSSLWAVSVETGLAIAQAMLAGVDEGLGVGLHSFNPATAKEVLKVPDHWVPMWVLFAGYPAEDPSGGGQRPRRPLGDNFFRAQYGTPWTEMPEVTARLEREGMIQAPMDRDRRWRDVRALAERFGLPW
ncbi:nitroreductase family protein [Amycolatopsis sp. 3B14]|uniref:nitroreductase family protein n=1 Tax=Amycolatopsis sp. 3B14 TaxID=3243600 RepID=UPI003D983CAE